MNRFVTALLIAASIFTLGVFPARAQQPDLNGLERAIKQTARTLDDEKTLLRQKFEVLIKFSDKLPDGRSIFWTPDGRAAYFETGEGVPGQLLRGRSKPAQAAGSVELASFLNDLKAYQAGVAENEKALKELAQLQAEWRALCAQPGANRNIQGCPAKAP